ncbi:protein MCM10 homolog isoform X2 [Pristis pectinata]|uniref:protein MCM10 homolog isoform X2 n=1 Tax=Pristis pectinata TaxID=685728 RepID=UPI00223E35E2|nr:protein MCM10 homolog isoform X2 [Pristis pectinata]
MTDNDDLDLLASLLEENEEEDTVADAGCSQDEQSAKRSLEEADEWDELFDKEEEDDVQATELSALFGDVDDLEEEEEGEERRNTDATEIDEHTSPIPDQKKSEKSRLELEEELERMKEQMEKLQRQLTKVADGPNSIASSGKDSPDNKLKALGQGTCTSQNIKKSNSFQQDRCRSSSNLKHDLLKSKLHKAPEPTRTPTERSPQTQPANEQPRQLQNKPNPIRQNLPTTIRASERPGTSRATNPDISVDKFSGLRLRNPIVSSTEMERKMHGRKLIRLSQLHSKLANEKLEDTDWVTFGVIIKKITPQSSNNGKTFSIWNLSDLRSNLNLSLFLFGNVHKEHWKTDSGTVIGLLNANPMKPRDGTDEVCLSVDHPQKILIMGEALDMGTCRARKKNGDPCTHIVNLMDCEYCEYHVKAQYKKLSAKRADLQSSFSGRAPSRMNGKHGSLKERLCQQGFHYGGISSASYAASVKAAGPNKSVQLTLTQMMVKGADDIVRETKKNIALTNGKGLTGCSDEFKDLMQLPTFGARNLKKHLTKAPMKGGSVNNAQPGPAVLSISASELLKQQKQKMLETRKRKAEELQKSFLQSKSVYSGYTSRAGGLSIQTSPKVGAVFPKEQKLVATPQTPKLGGGLSQGEDILFFDTSPPSASKLNHNADTKKMVAIMKLHKKGAVLAKEDPNSVKRKLPHSGEKLLERIKKNLSSPDGNDEPISKKHRAQLEYLDSEEFQKILNAKSRHIGTVQEAEIEFQEQYFEPLVKKEQMEEKMKSIREMKCRVVSCKTCKYTHFKPLETCVSENHDYHWHDAVKRFFKCPCGSRAIALTRLPKKNCSNCGLFKWERDGMLKERKGPKIGGELLLPRGEEHGKFLSSSK